MALSYGIMLWHYAMALCYDIMLWHYAMALCCGIKLWHYAEEIMQSAADMSVILLNLVILDDTHYTGFYYSVSLPECLYTVWVIMLSVVQRSVALLKAKAPRFLMAFVNAEYGQ
jgi:hypothetical protein